MLRTTFRAVYASALVCTGAVSQRLDAQAVVNSTFTAEFGSYSDPANWSPQEVPNNTSARSFNVTLNAGAYIYVDTDATISNLTIRPGAQTAVGVFDHTLTVQGRTQATRPNIIVGAYEGESSTFDAGTLSSFKNGALTGDYAAVGSGPATLRFRRAHVRRLTDAHLILSGVASRITDEHGNDALRDLAEIDVASILSLEGASVVTGAPLAVNGVLDLGQHATTPTTFTATASLKNFDASTRTLAGGSFILRPFDASNSAPIELRFVGADIVNNGSAITLVNDTSRIADLTGLDGLRNLARNLPGGSLTMQNRSFLTLGDFTNDGILALTDSSFAITGTLRNFAPATRTLRSGSYQLEDWRDSGGPVLRFVGADIVHNRAAISLTGKALIVDELGNDALRNFVDNRVGGRFVVGPGHQFTGPGHFENAGQVETLFSRSSLIPEAPPPPPHGAFKLPAGAGYTQTSGSTLNNGSFTAGQLQIMGGSLSGGGTITGDVTLANAQFSYAGYIDGNLTLSAATRSHFAIGEYSTVTSCYISGTGVVAGMLNVRINAENYLSSDETLLLLHSKKQLTGQFRNAPDGARIATVDGSGSFVVRYDAKNVRLTEFQARPRPAQLLNISTRGFVLSADDAFGNRYLTAGFIITGSSAKTVLLRGIGPSLARHGIATPLDNPRLELRGIHAGAPIATNEDWQDTQKADIEATGLAPEDSRESAIKVTLEPGAYTCLLQDTGGLPGAALIEVYDLSPTPFSKLANISTRGFTEAGGALIGGIIAGGNGQGDADLVLRALGPSLRRSGIFTAMDNPTLEVRDENGGVVAFNDDWFVNNDQFEGAAGELRPYENAESAMRLSLPRGLYTALVRSKSGAQGTALVEVYDLRR